MKFKVLLATGLFLFLTGNMISSNYLFFIEIQGVAGYSTEDNKIIFYSHHPTAPMQKPSFGFDFIKKFSTETSDFATLYVQPRLAMTANDETTLEFQIYNAFIKFKLRDFDLWIGHSKPAFGLSLYFDTHAHLLQPLTMNGFYSERDWGIGMTKDYANSSIALSLTTGSGMDLFFKGNWLFSTRYSRGFLNSNNWQAGISLSLGKKAKEMMQEVLLPEELMDYRMAGADFSFLINNIENRAEFLVGRMDFENAYAFFWRTTASFLEDGKLKIELQPAIIRESQLTRTEISAGISYFINADTTIRGMTSYDSQQNDWRIIFQIYFYKNLF